jgi:hypothetical protein
MDYIPKSEEDIAKAGLLPAAEYDFDVLSSTPAKSKAGNDMIKLKIGIYDGDKITRQLYDYLLGAMEAKLRHFCDSVGLLSKYENGTFCAEDCLGRSGRCKIVQKDAEGNYPPKNKIRDYVCRASKPLTATRAEEPSANSEDNLPF